MASEAAAVAGANRDILTGYDGLTINLAEDVLDKCVKISLDNKVAKDTLIFSELAADRAMVSRNEAWVTFMHRGRMSVHES